MISPEYIRPDPVKGVTKQIFHEIVANKMRFVERSSTIARRENGPLASYLELILIVSPERDLADEWVYAYYSIFSRSAKKLNIPMLQVSQDLIDAYSSEQGNILQKVTEAGDQQGIESYFAKLAAESDIRVASERDRNLELQYFWNILNLWEVRRMTHLGINIARSVELLKPLYDLMTLFWLQEDANRLADRFPLLGEINS